MPEVVGDAAVLVDPLDVDAITQAVRRLYAHPDERRAFVRCGLNRVQQFTWKNTAEQVARIYEKVLNRSPIAATTTAPKSRENSSNLRSSLNSQGEL